MRQCDISFSSLRRAAFVAAIWSCMATTLWAASNIITPSSGYQATDCLTTVDPTAMDVFDDWAAVYADEHLTIYDRNTWQSVYDLGDANYGGTTTTYNSFVTFDPSGNSLWVGYTVGGNVDDRIYQVTNLGSTPTWNHIATLPSNYELAFSKETPYISGLNSTAWGGPNAIWLLDVTGNNQHDKIADVGGFAAGMAFDTDGNLYYGTNLGANDTLVRFTTEQVGQGGLQLSDAETLTRLPFPGADVEVDSADHVLFTVNEIDANWNQLGSTLAMWDGTSGDGDHYKIIGTAGDDHWYTVVRTTGGVAYLNDGGAWGNPVLGLAEIRAVSVPEPSTLILAAGSLLMFWWWRRQM